MLILATGAMLYVGGGYDAPTEINSTWSEDLVTATSSIEEVELLSEPTSGGLGGAEVTPNDLLESVASSSGVAAAGLDVKVGGGLGGAFFGTGATGSGAYGKRIVYIVDASGSMAFNLVRTSRFYRVQVELEKSIQSLDKSQQFAVIFFNRRARPVGQKYLRNATSRTKDRMVKLIQRSSAVGGTDPRGAIAQALRLKPDTIYFLTDGVFPSASAAGLMQKKRGLTVHTFTLGDSSGEAIMRRLAEVNGGRYQFIDGYDHSKDQSTAASGSNTGTPNTP